MLLEVSVTQQALEPKVKGKGVTDSGTKDDDVFDKAEAAGIANTEHGSANVHNPEDEAASIVSTGRNIETLAALYEHEPDTDTTFSP